MRRIFLILLLVLAPRLAFSQTDIHIAGPQSGFPIAVPQFCDAGGAEEFAKSIPSRIGKDLDISGIFKVLNPSGFVETPGKCGTPEQVVYSDWSVIGAEGLVKGEISKAGFGSDKLDVKLYLFDVQQQRVVLGKRYEANPEEFKRIADRFANEIVKFFTGEYGVFGTQIAYISRVGRFKELFLMDMDGTNSRQLTHDNGLVLSPAWSPNGDRIVYTSYRTRRPELYEYNIADSDSRRITERPGMELGAKYSLDGRTLVSSASTSGVSDIVLFDLAGKLIRALTRDDAIDVSPTWSPDGQQIAFCSNRAGGPQIYTMSSSGGNVKRISFTGSSYCTSPAWSPKGDKIVFVCRETDNGNQIFIGSPDGGKATQLTYIGNNEDPGWAADGRSVTYASSTGGGSAKSIFLQSLLGGQPKQVSFAKSDDSQPAWSPRFE